MRHSSPFRRWAAHVLAVGLVGLTISCGTGDKNSGKPPSVGRAGRQLSSDTTPPAVAVTAPAAGDIVRDVVNITATATDDGGPVVLAQLLVNGVAQQTVTQQPFAFTWDGSLRPEGVYEFKVVAVDAVGNLGSSIPTAVTLRHSLTTFAAVTPIILGGTVGTGTFAISGPVPNGAALALASNPPGVATFGPVNLTEGTIPKGSFNIITTAQPVDTVLTVSGTYQGIAKTFTVRVLAMTNPAINAFAVTSSIAGGTTASGSIRVQGTVPVTVALSSDNPAVVVPASVAVSAAGSNTSFAVNTTAVASPTKATIIATLPSGVAWTAATTVLPPMPHVVSLSGTPNPIAVGQTGTVTVSLDAPAPPGGATLAMLVFNLDSPTVPSLLIPPTITVPEGALVGTFPVVPTPYGGSFNTQITASLNGTSASIFPYKVTRTVFAGNAVYDASFRVPRCTGALASCDTGSLIDSRDNIFLETEPNAPNTLFGSCADGFAGIGAMPNRAVYHFDQSIDRVKVSTTDGSAIAPGKAVNIEVTVWSGGRLELYSAPDANNPVWTLITSQQVAASALRPVVVTVPFTVPAGTLQAIRAGFGIPPATLPPSPCSTDFQWSGYNDHDDLVFSTVEGPLTNQAPKVDAGPDQTIGLPAVAVLPGKTSDDGLPNPPAAFTSTWSKISGPGTVSFSPNVALTAATFSIAGTYVLQLTAGDGELTTTDTVTVNVNTGGAVNMAPTANAGADQNISLPGGATLTGSAADDGKPNPPGALTLTWSLVGGPGTATFGNPAALVTSVDFSAAGTYTLRLTANDGLLSASDDVVVVVNPPNTLPVANAGPDQVITLPDGATLAGTASDDGQPNPPGVLTVGWSQLDGPGSATFSAPAAATTGVAFSAPGTYTLRLSASDGALSSSDDVTVVVNPAITLKVQYRAVSPNVTDNQIRAGLNIVNVGPTAVPLRELKIRYWYTVDTNRAQTIQCEAAAIGCSRITGTFATVSPSRPGADRYLEVGFTSAAGTLGAGAQTGEIRGRIRKDDRSNYNEANDHSYASSFGAAPPTDLVDWTRITLYRNGVRIWGTEP